MSNLVLAPSSNAGKTWGHSFIEKAKSELTTTRNPTAVGTYLQGAALTGAALAEGGLLGALLGGADAKFGLDTKAGPLDFWIACISGALSIPLAGMPIAAEQSRNIAGQALAVFTYRRSFELVSHQPMARPAKAAATMHGDPIIECARGL